MLSAVKNDSKSVSEKVVFLGWLCRNSKLFLGAVHTSSLACGILASDIPFSVPQIVIYSQFISFTSIPTSLLPLFFIAYHNNCLCNLWIFSVSSLSNASKLIFFMLLMVSCVILSFDVRFCNCSNIFPTPHIILFLVTSAFAHIFIHPPKEINHADIPADFPHKMPAGLPACHNNTPACSPAQAPLVSSVPPPFPPLQSRPPCLCCGPYPQYAQSG